MNVMILNKNPKLGVPKSELKQQKSNLAKRQPVRRGGSKMDNRETMDHRDTVAQRNTQRNARVHPVVGSIQLIIDDGHPVTAKYS